MIHVDVDIQYLVVGSLGALCFVLGALGSLLSILESPQKEFGVYGAGLLMLAVMILSMAAYHSGQTYHPCKTDFSTMKQECR